MPDKKYKWYKIAESTEDFQFAENNIASIKVDNKTICIVKTTNGIKACTSKCPHAGGNMSEGFLDKNENIVCPLHRYTFNLNTGRDVTNEGYYLKMYLIKITPQGIFLGIEESGFLSWFK